MDTTTHHPPHPDTFTTYFADVGRHVAAFLDNEISINDIADYMYADAYADGVSARNCALGAIQADNIANGLYAALQRTPAGNGATDTADNSEESSLVNRSLPEVLKEHRPSVRHFNGNLSAPDEYITDGRILLVSEHIRTPGRLKKYRDRVPDGREHRSVSYDSIKKVIPDFASFVPADYFGYATRPGFASVVFKVRATWHYICLDADLYSIVADVYGRHWESSTVLVHPDNATGGPVVYLPYWYKRTVFALIMPVRHRIEHPELRH